MTDMPTALAPEPVQSASYLHDFHGFRAMIAQAAAIAVQDAVANMRNVNTVATAAIGAAQQLAIGGKGVPSQILELAEQAQAIARNNFDAISVLAARLLAEQEGQNAAKPGP